MDDGHSSDPATLRLLSTVKDGGDDLVRSGVFPLKRASVNTQSKLARQSYVSYLVSERNLVLGSRGNMFDSINSALLHTVDNMEPSARDDDGRGTHVAFCLVDNQVRDASYYGLAHEIAKGEDNIEPSFPVAFTVRMPLSIAWNASIAIGSNRIASEIVSKSNDEKRREPERPILKSEALRNPDAPFVASFSGRGSSRFISDIIKDVHGLPSCCLGSTFFKVMSSSLVSFRIYLMSQREKSMLSLTKRPDLHESRHIDLPKATNTCLVYGTSIEEYLRIWGNISRTLGSAILTNASSRMKLTNHKEINYPS
ncbi:hypothetical protein E3N88_19849 [Mikania micrantha]|uniref:Uncharacterized protein n=1 Tax=Mikania micrantha TaxID=192012 RepID=A0A5N6NRA7_9ASTR|nr:hypothetical protein E3N88_19849 [Mikania micrantha]